MYEIVLSPEAREHLKELKKHEPVAVVEAMKHDLSYEPLVETRNRKPLRPNPIAPWELRVGRLRVFYDANVEPAPVVYVNAIGVKIRSQLWIGGEKITS
jgi:mRNA-degrading endonuclease RelE of RelBE toxin-antitoxin system